MEEAKLAELERKVDVIMKGLTLFLFGEGDVLSENEVGTYRSDWKIT